MPIQTVNPQVMARAVWRETLRVFNVENQQAFIGSPALARTGENLGGLVPIAGGLLALGIVLRSRRKHSTP